MELKTKFQDEDFEKGEVVDVQVFLQKSGGIVVRVEKEGAGTHEIRYENEKEFCDDWEDVDM